jgi:hypothetical protein
MQEYEELWREGKFVWLAKDSSGTDAFCLREKATPMQILESDLELQRREGKPVYFEERGSMTSLSIANCILEIILSLISTSSRRSELKGDPNDGTTRAF